MIVLLRGAILIPHLTPATRFSQRLLGYMGQSAPPAGHAILLSPCRSIHTCFMRFPIDVLFLDRDLRIVRITRNLRPWRIALGTSTTTSVIELPSGSPRITSLNEGDPLHLLPTA